MGRITRREFLSAMQRQRSIQYPEPSPESIARTESLSRAMMHKASEPRDIFRNMEGEPSIEAQAKFIQQASWTELVELL